jgi:hypothetical protein
LLAGLEVFVAADLIRTVSVDLTLQGVGSLGLLMIIRTILRFSATRNTTPATNAAMKPERSNALAGRWDPPRARSRRTAWPA